MNNRIIKFRLYNEYAKSFVKDSKGEISKFTIYDLAYYFYDNRIGRNQEYLVLQQLVLTYNDGKELYEGDIISWQDSQEYFETAPEGDILVIEYDQEYTKFIARSLTDGTKYEAGDCRCDIIEGNIFENPELLKI